MARPTVDSFKKGDLVRHTEKSYVGRIEGFTEITSVLEHPSDTRGVRVVVEKPGEPSSIKVASPRLLENLSELPIEERHRALLEFRGLPWKGVRARQAGDEAAFHRITHCWYCKRGLDSFVDVECRACGGILCSCGACFSGTTF